MKHPLGRPDMGATDVLRLAANGRWVKDDGKPGRAFSGYDARGFPIAWGPDCGCGFFADRCPFEKAMDITTKRYGCANGHPFDSELP